jgi:hypothetical protein
VFHTYIDWTTEDSPRPFYVGKGTEYRTRNPERNRKHRYVRKHFGHRREVVFTSEDSKACLDREIALVAEHHTYIGDPLASEISCNFTKGGEGSTGCHVLKGRPKTRAHRNAIAKAKRGWRHPVGCACRVHLPQKHALSDNQRVEARALHEYGWTLRRIAAHFKVGTMTIQRACSE